MRKEEENLVSENNLLFKEEEQSLLYQKHSNEKNIFPEENENLLDEILRKGVLTKYSIFIWIVTILFQLVNGMEMCLFCVTIIPLKEKFDLSQGLVSLVSSIICVGVALGSYLSGILSDKFGRLLVINLSQGLTVLTHIIMCLFLVLPVFIITRFLTGILVGILLPIIMNILGEYQQAKYRGFVLLFNWFFYGMGQVLENLIALGVMPNLQQEKLKLYLWILLIFPLLSFISSILFLNDSPRHLIINNDINNDEKSLNQAINIITSLNKGHLPEEEKIKIINEVESAEANKEVKGKIKELFNRKYLRTTIILMTIHMILSFSYFCSLSVSSLALDKMIKEDGEKKYSNRDIIINQIFIGMVNPIANLIGGFIIEIKCLGRKKSLILFFAIMFITFILMVISVILFQIFSPISLGIGDMTANLAICITIEVYPTKLRDISSGFCIMMNRILCVIILFIFVPLLDVSYKIPFIITSILCFIGLPLSYFIPYESIGKQLDEN